VWVQPHCQRHYSESAFENAALTIGELLAMNGSGTNEYCCKCILQSLLYISVVTQPQQPGQNPHLAQDTGNIFYRFVSTSSSPELCGVPGHPAVYTQAGPVTNELNLC
jgi:hypothetical protein